MENGTTKEYKPLHYENLLECKKPYRKFPFKIVFFNFFKPMNFFISVCKHLKKPYYTKNILTQL